MVLISEEDSKPENETEYAIPLKEGQLFEIRWGEQMFRCSKCGSKTVALFPNRLCYECYREEMLKCQSGVQS